MSMRQQFDGHRQHVEDTTSTGVLSDTVYLPVSFVGCTTEPRTMELRTCAECKYSHIHLADA